MSEAPTNKTLHRKRLDFAVLDWTVAFSLLGFMVGWWGRQLTIEVPPKWFHAIVTEHIRTEEVRMRKIEEAISEINDRMSQ